MNAVASFGCHLTAEQERLLMQSTYSILISYDMDKAGITGINDIIDRMKYKMNIKIAKIPFGKDAGELSADEINDAISESMDIHEWRKR
jgi:DNA primase